ncbi:hypothetical protein Tco_0738625, partial [Tanacetum coccineum]
GLEVPGALSKKSKSPKSKKPQIETKVTPPKLMEGSKQSHSVSSGTIPDPQDLERNIQLASTRLPSILNEGTRKSQPLPESTATHPKDSGGNIQPLDRDLTSTTSSEGAAKITPRPEGSLGDKDSGENIPPDDMEPIQPTIVDLSGAGKPSHEGELDTQPPVLSTYAGVRAFLLSDNEAQESEEDILGADKPQSSHAPSTKASNTDSTCDDILKKYDNILSLTERQLVNYADLKASIDDYYDENIAHRHHTDKLVEASMSFLNKSSNIISDLYKGLNIITELLKEIKNAVKDDSAHALKQCEELAAWAKSSTNMAWNLGSRLSGLERAQNNIQSSMSSLKEDTHSIKAMMTKMYEVFKGQSLGSITPTLTLTHIPANVEGENATNTATEEPPSHTEGETEQPKIAIPISSIQPTTITTHLESSQAAPIIDKGKGIETNSDEDPSKKLVPASTIVRSNPDEEAKVPYMINGKMCYLINKEMQAYLDKEEKPRKAAEEERLLAISKPEVIKVVQEEAEMIG